MLLENADVLLTICRRTSCVAVCFSCSSTASPTKAALATDASPSCHSAFHPLCPSCLWLRLTARPCFRILLLKEYFVLVMTDISMHVVSFFYSWKCLRSLDCRLKLDCLRPLHWAALSPVRWEACPGGVRSRTPRSASPSSRDRWGGTSAAASRLPATACFTIQVIFFSQVFQLRRSYLKNQSLVVRFQ